MATTCWWYYIAKFTEFFDTLFFILRKKTEHVSTLHVIHHGCMPFSVWMGLKFAPGKRNRGNTRWPKGMRSDRAIADCKSVWLAGRLGCGNNKQLLGALDIVRFPIGCAHCSPTPARATHTICIRINGDLLLNAVCQALVRAFARARFSCLITRGGVLC